jgi:hypothetical protein
MMKGIAPWLVGSFLAFLVTSASFLLLANLGSAPSEIRLDSPSPPPISNSSLDLGLDEARLASLGADEGQSITLDVRNGGEEVLSDIALTIEVYSEDTALGESERYRKTIPEITPGETAAVPFELDLSPPEENPSHPGPEPPRTIIEVRATTPSGVSAIRTGILQP